MTTCSPASLPRRAAMLLVATGLLAVTARAAEPTTLPFEPHAVFFSAETRQPKPIDPQVFVRDQAASAGTGPQGIVHAAGFRPALIQQDPHSTPLFNAQGKALGFTLGEWLGAGGTATITPGPDGKVQIAVSFTGLRPGGRYSLFENYFDQTPVGFTPLDGMGTGNSFTASTNGAARLTVLAPAPLTHANAVLLVFHSDGKDHGMQRGDIGVTAQHQLIARAPG